jgi:hypothetical protein
MAPDRYDSVYEESSQDYPLPYILTQSCLNPNMEAYLKLLADRRIKLRNPIRRLLILLFGSEIEFTYVFVSKTLVFETPR